MARLAAESGVTAIVATPHCNLPQGPSNYRSTLLLEKLQALNLLFSRSGIPITVYPGAEVLARENLLSLLRDGKLMTLNNSRYLLTEFFFGESPENINDTLSSLRSAGVIPVVAHPERYEAVQRDPMLVVEWFRSGCIIQLNKGSILGRLGNHSRRAALWLLDQGLAHVIASDAHHPDYRTPYMGELVSFLSEHYPPPYIRLLLEKNPGRIVENRRIPPPSEES